MDAANTEPDVSRRPAERSQWLLAFIATFWIAVGGAFLTTGAGETSLSKPFEYRNDGLMALLPVKTLVDTGWWYEDDRLGAPDKMTWYDFPVNPNVHFAILKVMSLVERDPFRLLNAYVLFGFPLVAVCALAALKAMRLPILPSVVGALLFAFAPYHFWRGAAHPWLSNYFTIALGMIVIAWLAQDRAGLLFDAGEGRRWKLRLFSRETLAAVLICAALGFDFPYYPVFLCFLLLVTGIYVALNLNSWRPLARSGLLIALTAGFFLLNLLPNLLYRLEEGPNVSAGIDTNRDWQESEAWGLKIAALLMPVREHPIPAFEATREEYHTNSVVLSSGDSMALGTIAAAGFLVLLAWGLFRLHRGRGPFAGLMDSMSVLNLACVLLATVGGLGAVTNLLSLQLLRCYDRISIVIMFLAIVPVCIFLAAIERRAGTRPVLRTAYFALAGMILLGGVWEQSRYFRRQTEDTNTTFLIDRKFVKQIEAVAGAEASIFQYPVQPFLANSGPALSVDPYALFRGYLHSSTLTWSTGAVEGRLAARVHEYINSLPAAEAVEKIALLGFDGIYLDRSLYQGKSGPFEAELVGLTGTDPIVSADGRLAFYPLAKYLADFEARTTAEERRLSLDRLMRPVAVDWVGFDIEEVVPGSRYRWCHNQEAKLQITNFGNDDREVELSFLASGAVPTAGTFKITGLSLEHSCPIALGSRTPVSLRVTVPPGTHEIDFATDAGTLVTGLRNVVFRIDGFAMRFPDEQGLTRHTIAEAPAAAVK